MICPSLPRLRLGLLLALALVLALAACTRERVPVQARMNAALTPPTVIADWLIEGRNDFMLFDVRSEAAFEAGHLPGAVHADPAELQQPGVVRALPDYKKLVFYGADNGVSAETLAPLFRAGLHVMVIEGGYAGWERAVLAKPERVSNPAEARQDAIARHFRGESALGSPQPLEEISAEEYLRPPQLPAAQPAPTYEMEGC